MTAEKTAGLILAAGFSSRMGAFKPLLPIGDMTALERVSRTLKKAGIQTVIGVTGFGRERLCSVFSAEGITEAYNPDYEKGMFSSIKAGIRLAMEGLPATSDGRNKPPDGFFLMPVDCPLVPPEVLEQILKKREEAPDSFIVPCYRGKKGHPLFIPARFAAEILSYEGEGGLKAITSRYEDRIVRLEVDTEAVVLDMDTPEGYEEILDYRQKRETGTGCGKEPGLKEMMAGRRLFLVRHGEIRQHKEKIFLGQADIPLSERGREQAAAAAEELLRYGASAKRIYTSDLIRAAETAEIIRSRMNLSEVVPAPKLREMSLGEWDGRFISEIREKYPQEYQKRGENLLTYKYGNDSENYYDLQYRVMKGLRNILKQEQAAGGGRDLIFVTHAGVIHVILSNLRGTSLEDEIRNRTPNGGVVMIEDANAKEKL